MKINDFKLERFFAKYEFTVPYLLCTSDCESMSVKDLLSLEKNSEKKLKNLWLGYTESQGNQILRKEISKLYKKIKSDEVLVFAGAEEGIFVFMNWVLDINFLKRNIRKNTKAIVINCPHNPTGYLMSKEKFKEIINIAKKYRIYLFSDEVYRFCEYNKKDRLPAACDIYDKGVSLGVMSKTFGLAGLRIGWVATKDKELLKKLASFKDFTTICSSAPSEFLSIIALRNKEKLIKRNLGIIKKNVELLDKFFAKYKNIFEWVRPKAGSIAFPKIKFNKNIEKFCIDLLNQKGVLLLPSTLYDFDNKHFRIGFGRKNMLDALNKFEEYIKENFD